ncbi:hypothetical protein NW762_008064 [Fusarium torreyae]|uniref:Nucleoside phosphorylase domain-containing protein n=1 Tax=Fusarium torreyae TaxID=1237075 RepID=A0A9W8RYG6_9HYPO|nr:hypothetical protein NW762_008064 [Fusarium torreyae]
MSLPPGTRPSNFLIGWVCILEPEYYAAMDVLDESYGTSHKAGFFSGNSDPNMYQLGRIEGHKVVINVPQSCEGGLLNASQIASYMKSTFSYIRFVLLVGIGGGGPSSTADVRLGDVVFGDSVIPYKKGKHTDFGFEIDANKLEPPRELLGAVTQLRYKLRGEPPLEDTINEIADQNCTKKETYRRPKKDRLVLSSILHRGAMCDCLKSQLEDVSILVRRRKRLPGTLIETHRGIIGSADQVLKSAKERDRLSREENIICFEMEAAAMLRPTRSISIRGISDYADGHKDDKWHNYAAMAAAVCAKKLLIALEPEAVLNTTIYLTQEELTRRFEGAISRVEMKLRKNEDEPINIKEANDELQNQVEFLTDFVKEQKPEYERTKGISATLDSFRENLDATIRTLEDRIDLQRKQVAKSDYVTQKVWEELKDQVEKTKKNVDRLGMAKDPLATFGEVTDSEIMDIKNRHAEKFCEYVTYSSTLAGKVSRWKWRKSVGAIFNTREQISHQSLQLSGPSTSSTEEPFRTESTGQSSIYDKQQSQSLRHRGELSVKPRISSSPSVSHLCTRASSDQPSAYQSADTGNPPPMPPRPGVAPHGGLNRPLLDYRRTSQLTTIIGPSNSSRNTQSQRSGALEDLLNAHQDSASIKRSSVKDKVRILESNN